MKIGLFTDTYRPATNGVVYVVDITRRELEALGHEVYIFAPSANLLGRAAEIDRDDSHVIHFPAIKGVGFSESQLSVFFPPRILKKIRELKLDVLYFFTTGQIGAMAAYAARKTHAVLIGQHSTDVYEYAKNYPFLTALALPMASIILPVTLDLTSDQKKLLAKMYVPQVPHRVRPETSRSSDAIGATLSILYGACDATVALSRKSAAQLAMLADKNHEKLNLKIIPTGVDALPVATENEVQEFRENLGLEPSDEVVMYVGRLGEEKNLALLIPMMEKLLERRPNAKLVFVGDFDFRDQLEKMAKKSRADGRIIFAGRLPREKLSVAYQAANVFAFPSLTDTQGLVIQEAAHAGLPLVLCDSDLSECLVDGENGFLAENEPSNFADKVATILADEKLRARFGARSRELAAKLTERVQTEKIVELFREIFKNGETFSGQEN